MKTWLSPFELDCFAALGLRDLILLSRCAATLLLPRARNQDHRHNANPSKCGFRSAAQFGALATPA
jgi:hypothetical protein